MKRCLLFSMALILVLLPLPVWAQTAPGGGLLGSAHDFTLVHGTTTPRTAGGVPVGLCTYCHTPHKAAQTLLLWNHTLSQNTFFWSDATTTMGGTLLPTISTAWSGPTKLCLSCHDGSVAVADLLWFNAQAWQGANALSTFTLSRVPAFQTATTSGDLAGNHPVAFPYPYNGSPNSYNGVTTGNRVILTEYVDDPTASGIRLFNDVGLAVSAGPVSGHTGMECSTCHDPHNGPTVQDLYLIRGKLGGSDTHYICLMCHKM